MGGNVLLVARRDIAARQLTIDYALLLGILGSLWLPVPDRCPPGAW